MCFSQRYGLAILKLLTVYTREDQISKHILNNESQISHFLREVTNRKEGRLE